MLRDRATLLRVTVSSPCMNLKFVPLPRKIREGIKYPHQQLKHCVRNLYHALQGFWNWCEWQGRKEGDDDFKGRTL